MDLKVLVLAFVTGVVLGVVFGLFGLPYPAPAVFEGVMGVVGVWLGGALAAPWLKEIVSRFFGG